MNPYKILFLAGLLCLPDAAAWAQEGVKVSRIRQLNPSAVEVLYENGSNLTIDFYGNNIFRLFQDNNGGIVRDPESNPSAKILVDNPRTPVSGLSVSEQGNKARIATKTVAVEIDKATSLLTVVDLRNGKVVLRQAGVPEFKSGSTTIRFNAAADEYFYGGGVQNGRFSHRGKTIDIVNTNSWTDGGVCSPAPFYWSTNGYGVMYYTFKPGRYDFDSENKGVVTVRHDQNYLDMFVMVDATPTSLLNDYYQLTGNPVLLPKFAFYEGHLNAYNRDFWKESTDGKGVLFEDGKRYVESQKDNGGVKESLNGENGNYQFSARAVVDRYKAHDMPLGWVLPNDGYGAGYGQTETLDGNIANLKSFGDYARAHGVEVGLWTQSNLHPQDSTPALLQRDIVKEVRDAGVRVLKTDVAWVGAGYSFGLNGIADVAHIMPYYGNAARPFIITLDGWAGTQRYGGVWTGDQTGGEWEYIRFHIPTYIGAGLSGMSNITSDMDGIFGGKNMRVNIRDFQWKTFSPMQLNMDGWGSNEKYPQVLGEPATSINRNYLKLKSELLPYAYTYSHEAISGKPLIRAMMLDYPNDYTLGTATRYQYMFGRDILVAPVYQETAVQPNGDDIRDGIYLPEGKWIDYFTGVQYDGGRVLNNFATPLWKIPVFVKAGAIIPLVNPNNNVHEIDHSRRIFEFYPSGRSEMEVYDDDGTTEAYKAGAYATTKVVSDLDKKGGLTITVHAAKGSFEGMHREQTTLLKINATQRPKSVKAFVNGKKVDAKVSYEEQPEFNRFSTKGSEMEKVKITRNPQILVELPKIDIGYADLKVEIKGYVYDLSSRSMLKQTGVLAAPKAPVCSVTPYSITPKWEKIGNADYYEVEYGGQIYSTIKNDSLKFEDLQPNTEYEFCLRAVNKDGAGEWTAFRATTAADPLKYALKSITAELVGAKDMGGFGLHRLFDFTTSGDIWHTDYSSKAVPFSITMDLHCTTALDKIEYLPRPMGLNGVIQEGTIEISKDKKNWQQMGSFAWKADNKSKTFALTTHPEARFVRMNVTKAVGNFGSGTEMYVYQVPGAKKLIPGDINQDGKIDENDLTSYMNYTGLKRGDADFEGYISNGDINGNGMIDAADISNVAIYLNDGIKEAESRTLGGKIALKYDKASYAAGDEVQVVVEGTNMSAVNALNLILPYVPQQMRFVKVEAKAVGQMQNLTYDRRHTDGTQVLYPTFVNVGDQTTLDGNQTLFVLHFKALRSFRPGKTTVKGMLVDKNLNELNF